MLLLLVQRAQLLRLLLCYEHLVTQILELTQGGFLKVLNKIKEPFVWTFHFVIEACVLRCCEL
jgi:hypothetical protein